MSGKNGAKSIGFAVLQIGLVIAAVALIAVLVLHFTSQSGRDTRNAGYTDMDPLLEKGEPLPEKEFGKLTVRWILGSYASEEGGYEYYLAIAPDLSLITIRTGDKEEIAQLEALADQYGNAGSQEQVDAIPGYEARGRIEKIQEEELKQYYEETLDEIGFDAISGLKKSDLLIDSSAIPDRNVFLSVVLPVIGLAVLAVLAAVLRKHKKQQTAASEKE